MGKARGCSTDDAGALLSCLVTRPHLPFLAAQMMQGLIELPRHAPSPPRPPFPPRLAAVPKSPARSHHCSDSHCHRGLPRAPDRGSGRGRRITLEREQGMVGGEEKAQSGDQVGAHGKASLRPVERAQHDGGNTGGNVKGGCPVCMCTTSMSAVTQVRCSTLY